MTNLVDPEDVARIVGVGRHLTAHFGRAVSAEQVIYILHSHECLASGRDLRECPYSLALDVGAPVDVWEGFEDRPVELAITNHCGQLIPKELDNGG